jgi:hypothetical protein
VNPKMNTTLETDYLIAGSGAVGMAFADTLLSDSAADMVIVDRHPAPGGHWNDAYPFVTLHQPSAFYGVNSLELSKGFKDEVGLNKGLGDLASGAEVLAYFDQVMRHRFLPSGRVRYFPMSEFLGDGKVRSLVSGETMQITARRKTVDATYLKTSVPSTHKPSFSVQEGVRFMPLNHLPSLNEPPEGFVVIGGGKTGIDACLWLLDKGVDPDRIRWIMPRDAWLLDRRNAQSAPEFFEDAMGAQAAQFEACAQAESIDDLFDRLEAAGVLLRIDQSVRPSMFHGATVSQAELQALRRIKNVVRMGRLQRIERDQIVLQQGTIATSASVVHVDCSASAIPNLVMKPIFEPGLITPQTVRSYQPVFSAALIAHVEATREGDEEKNKLCNVVPLPNHDTDWIRMMIVYMTNQYQWSRDQELRQWLLSARLDGFSAMAKAAVAADPAKAAIMQRIRESVFPAVFKLQKLAAEIGH